MDALDRFKEGIQTPFELLMGRKMGEIEWRVGRRVGLEGRVERDDSLIVGEKG